MTTTSRLTVHRRLPLALIALLAPLAGAQGTLPDARAVLARYAEVTNAAKFATVPGYRVKGTVEIPANGLSGSLEGYADRSGRAVQIVTLAGIGEMKEGVDTAFAWSLNPIEGPKLMEGREFAEKREREDPRAMRRDPAVVLEAETVGDTTIDGDACVKVKLGWKSGRKTTEYYSRKTGLLMLAEGLETSSMGEIATATTYSDYKAFEGIMIPTTTVQRAVGTEVIVRYTEVVFGAIDPARLAIPAEIQALRKK